MLWDAKGIYHFQALTISPRVQKRPLNRQPFIYGVPQTNELIRPVAHAPCNDSPNLDANVVDMINDARRARGISECR